MKFKAPLLTGHLIRRYKRFMADIELTSGKIITAHCANSGAMLDLLEEGNKVWVSPAQNPDRKLKYTWELVETDGTMVGVNTSLPNGLAEEGILSGFFTDLQGYDSIKREVKYGQNSRIDILLSKEDGSKCFVEVKNVHLKRGHRAEFPDSVTSRGTKHLNELMAMVDAGDRSVMVYIIQRDDCKSFSPARDLDPVYGDTLDKAARFGVELLAADCRVTPDEIVLNRMLPVEL